MRILADTMTFFWRRRVDPGLLVSWISWISWIFKQLRKIRGMEDWKAIGNVGSDTKIYPSPRPPSPCCPPVLL